MDGNSISRTPANDGSESRVRSALRGYGQQKRLAINIGVSESSLSKFIDGQLPVFLRLIDELGLEVVDRGEIRDLKNVLKRYL